MGSDVRTGVLNGTHLIRMAAETLPLQPSATIPHQMLIVRNRFIPFGTRYSAINLLGILFVKRDTKITDRLLNHERIHTAQMRELLYVFFYIIYIAEWLWRLIPSGGNGYNAYRSIKFEHEAYCHDSDLSYIKNRRLFAQWRNTSS